MSRSINYDFLKRYITGRVKPNIYAFKTGTYPEYLKVGDTYRPVETRIKEWSRKFKNLEYIAKWPAVVDKSRVDKDLIFRDYEVHKYLIGHQCERLKEEEAVNPDLYSNEFFHNAEKEDIKDAIEDITRSAENGDNHYNFFNPGLLPEELTPKRGPRLELRENQAEVVENFKTALKNKRNNLLMFAVMRFGKTFTALSCVQAAGFKRILVLSAKADVEREWYHAVNFVGNFEGYTYATVEQLKVDSEYITNRKEDETLVLFLTLQDLQGGTLKFQHKQVIDTQWDLVIVDETHFGARAQSYGYILNNAPNISPDSDESKEQEGNKKDAEELKEHVKGLKRKVTLHLSGTPYRVLMGGEFTDDDIIAFVQYSDIANAQQKWIDDNCLNSDFKDWENPYYGFPQMIRFAFNPNQSSLDKIRELENSGATTSFAEIFRPMSVKKASSDHNKFVHEAEVIDFLKTIDGSKDDTNVLGFLDNKLIKEGSLCRHIVIVLPYCASCDALEKLIKANRFKNLSEYEIINISGPNSSKKYPDTDSVKNKIADCEKRKQKTITLTVNRMLTGSTVKEWDTMIFLKNTTSPEEYDQAVFRLQSPYLKEYRNETEEEPIKVNLKPQTILVDFNPQRMFCLQELKSQIYNTITQKKGNDNLEGRIKDELKYSPIISLDHLGLREIGTSDIMEAVRSYASTRSVNEEAASVPIDASLLTDSEILDAIKNLLPLSSKKGISQKANDINGEENDIEANSTGDKDNSDNQSDNNHDNADDGTSEESHADDSKNIAGRISSYFALILYFAFLTEEEINGIDQLLGAIESTENNRRIARHLGLSTKIIELIKEKGHCFTIRDLDYKIKHLNQLGNDMSKTPEERIKQAFTKFSRISESEVVMRDDIVDLMIAQFPENLFEDENAKVLDIASKQGEFAAGFLRRYGNRPEVRDKIYSVCTSGTAYEFTYKIYSMLDMPVENIFSDFTSYGLINLKNKKQPYNTELVSKLKEMNFTATVGNPPYNIVQEKTSDTPIYHLFMDAAFVISKIVSFITPARYIFNAGKTPTKWNEDRLNDSHFKIIKYSANITEMFPSVDIKGGAAICYRNENENYGPIIAYTAYSELNGILTKVSSLSKASICDIIYPQNKFNLSKLFEKYPDIKNKIGSNGREKRLTTSIFSLSEVFSEENNKVKKIKIFGLIGNKRTCRWISEDILETHPNTKCWKVILPKSNGSGAIGEISSTQLIGEPTIGEPRSGITQSFITFGAFKYKRHAEACLNYLKTKFVRALLGILKVTQDNSKDTWKFVPMQDFSSNEDIDWTKSIEEIDNRLFEKYHLTDKEIDFIKNNIKEM